MKEKDGSRAMTAYILICFLLAGAAGVGYKLRMERRDELADSYGRLYTMNQKIGLELAPNIDKYYQLVASEELKPIDANAKAATPEECMKIADSLNLKQGVGADDKVDIPGTPSLADKKSYVEYRIEIKLKNVLMGQWEAFLTQVRERFSKYAWVTDLRVDRTDVAYAKVGEMEKEGSDSSLWNVSFTLRWFGPKKTA